MCLLLIELYVVTNQPDTALTLINYIERQFAFLDLPKISSTDKEGLIKPVREQKELKKDSTDIATEAFRLKLTKCKIKIYLRTHQLKLCKKEWKTLMTIETNMVRFFISSKIFILISQTSFKYFWFYRIPPKFIWRLILNISAESV